MVLVLAGWFLVSSNDAGLPPPWVIAATILSMMGFVDLLLYQDRKFDPISNILLLARSLVVNVYKSLIKKTIRGICGCLKDFDRVCCHCCEDVDDREDEDTACPHLQDFGSDDNV